MNSNAKKPDCFNYFFHRKWLVLGLFCVASLLLLYSASGIKLKEDIMDLLPQQDPVVKKYKAMLAGFRGLDFMLIDVGPKDNKEDVSQEELISTADTMVHRMRAAAQFKDIYYKWDVGDISAAIDMLREHRASLFTADDRDVLDKRLEENGIRDTLGGWEKLLIESPAPFLAQSFSRDPLAMDLFLINKLKSFNITDGLVKINNGRIFSQDLRHILIVAMPESKSNDSEKAKDLVDFMDMAVRQSDAASSGKIHTAYIASHRFGIDNSEMIKSDIKKTITISLVSIFILSILVYRRTLLMTILTLVPALFGGIFASGMIRFFHPEISAISVGCGSMLVGVVVDYGIYFLYQTDQLSCEVNQERLVKILRLIFIPVLMCAGTTILAFLALQLSVMPGVRQIGLFAAFGVAGATFFTLVALPLLIPGKALLKRKGPLIPIANLYPPYFRWVERQRRPLMAAIAVLSVVLIAGIYRVEFEGDIQKLNAASLETKRDWNIIIKSFGDMMNSTSVAVVAPTLDDALMRNDRLYPKLRRLQEGGFIKGINSMSVLFPGRARQEENRRRWQVFWNKERIDKVIKDVEGACLKLRINTTHLTEGLRGLPGPMPELRLEDFKASFLNGIISHRISISDGQAFILTNLSLNRDADYLQVMQSLEKTDPDAIVTNGKFFVQHTINIVYKELFVIGAVALLLIAVLLAIYEKRLAGFLRLLLPVLLSLFWTLGLMGWLDIKINIMNSIVVILIFGLGIDYIIFIDSTWKAAHSEMDGTLTRTSGAVTVSALSTILGMGGLLFAKHPALHAIGASTVIAIGVGIIAALLAVPLIGKRKPHEESHL